MNIISPNWLRTIVTAQLLVAVGAHAQLAKLVSSGELLPGGGATYYDLYAPRISDDGSIVFQSATSNAGGDNGLYLNSKGTTIEIARFLQTVPDANGYFTLFASASDYAVAPYTLAIAGSNKVVFTAGLGNTLGGNDDNSGIFLFNGTNLTQVAREGQEVQALGGRLGELSLVVPRINPSGQIAAAVDTYSNNTAGAAVFRYNNGNFTRVMVAFDPMPDGNGTMRLPTPPALNDSGMVAFTVAVPDSTNDSTRALCLFDGNNLKVLARDEQPVPNGDGRFASFMGGSYAFPPALNEQGRIAFVATLAGTSAGSADNAGVYVAHPGGCTELARKGQFVPGGNGRYLTFGNYFNGNYVQLNDSGQVVFTAELTGTAGGTTDNLAIYSVINGVIKQVVRRGQTAPDGNGHFFAFDTGLGLNGPALNNRGEIAFWATLTGTSGGASDNTGIFHVDSSGKISTVARTGQTIAGQTLTSIEPYSFFTRPTLGGATGFNNQSDIVFVGKTSADTRLGLFVWSGSRVMPPQVVGNNVNIPFTMIADRTNYVQTSTSLNPIGSDFTDISGPITAGGRRGIVATNFLHTEAAAGVPARYYRIRTVE